jgi:hypothetical protein
MIYYMVYYMMLLYIILHALITWIYHNLHEALCSGTRAGGGIVRASAHKTCQSLGVRERQYGGHWWPS